MLLQLLAGLVCILAAVLQLAVYRAPDVHDTFVSFTARRIMIAAMTVAGLYIIYCLMEYGQASNVYCLALGLCGLSQCLFAFNNLLKSMEKGHPRWNSHLRNSE